MEKTTTIEVTLKVSSDFHNSLIIDDLNRLLVSCYPGNVVSFNVKESK